MLSACRRSNASPPTPHFPHEDAVWAVPQRGLQQIANRHRRLVAVRPSRLEPHQIRFGNVELGRVFDNADAVLVGEPRREGIEEGGLARARALAMSR